MLFLLTLSVMMTVSTPEEFLTELCDSSSGPEGIEYWVDHASASVNPLVANPDSLSIILGTMQELNVIPGDRTLFESDGDTFRIEFGGSKWTWTDRHGNQYMREGLTVVLCTGGIYSWSKIPALDEVSASVGKREKLITGVILTFILIIFAFIILMWAKRRYL